MVQPIQITFRNMAASETLSEAIRGRAQWLETFHAGISGCRVALEFPHRHRKHGRPFSVHIQVSLPGEDVTVNHEAVLHRPATQPPDAHPADDDHRDAVVAIHDAFDAVRRRLEDAARRQRHD